MREREFDKANWTQRLEALKQPRTRKSLKQYAMCVAKNWNTCAYGEAIWGILPDMSHKVELAGTTSCVSEHTPDDEDHNSVHDLGINFLGHLCNCEYDKAKTVLDRLRNIITDNKEDVRKCMEETVGYKRRTEIVI